MKKILKKLVIGLLKAMAKHRLHKYKGKIIAITGSVGKSSAKDAIYTILNTRFRVKKTKKNMDSDFGLLLTILDIESGFNSATKWSWYLIKGFMHCVTRDHSDVLLFELGVDQPGEMDFLTSVLKPDIAIVTQISPVHLGPGQFKDINEIFEEKIKLVKAMDSRGIAILNIDNPYLENFRKKNRKKTTLTYGKDKEADFWVSQIKESLEGLDFILHHDNKRYDVHLNVVGECQFYAIMPAVICGVMMGMNVEDCVEAAKKFSLPAGRMSVIPAIHGATILDSSYNSSPDALKEALNTLKNIEPERRKIAVLGSMNELGEESKILHKSVGEMVPECAEMLITVGAEAVHFASAAKEKGMGEDVVFSFRNALDAAEFFKNKIKKGDLILVKGSQQNVKLENFVKELMEEPEKARELLVRQERAVLARLE
ncbi:MAG: UDP-N-acetylmuramoyl-tripeptide--D-alanyl-D-alanine ligase [Patescibacteria group bacterium]